MSKWQKKEKTKSLAWISSTGSSKCKFRIQIELAYLTLVLICNLWEHALFIIFPEISKQSHTLSLKQCGLYLFSLTTVTGLISHKVILIVFFLEVAFQIKPINQQPSFNHIPKYPAGSSHPLRGAADKSRKHCKDAPCCRINIRGLNWNMRGAHFWVKEKSTTPSFWFAG